MKNIGFIGMGNMAQDMVSGFIASGNVDGKSMYGFAPNQEKLAKNCKNLGINPCATVEVLVDTCETIFIACKPYQIDDIIAQLGEKLENKSLASVAAGWNFKRFREVLPEKAKIQCTMPNSPVSVSKGVILVEEDHDWDLEERKALLRLMESVGKVVELPDRLMKAGMAISGCGPAFMDMIIEALGDAAVKNGIQRKQAYELVCQTMIGSAELQLQTGIHPGQLKDNVCSPGGTSIKGVAALEEAGLRSAFIKAIDAVVKE